MQDPMSNQPPTPPDSSGSGGGGQGPDWTGMMGKAARRTTITGSVAETYSLHLLLGVFLSPEQIAGVRLSDEDVSVLVRYSWAIACPLPPRPETLLALTNPYQRHVCFTRMSGREVTRQRVDEALEHLLEQLREQGVEDAVAEPDAAGPVGLGLENAL